MKRVCQFLGTISAALLVNTAWAQAPAPGADAMLQASASVVQMVDQNKSAEIWDGAAKTAKEAISKQEFVSRITEARKILGEPKARDWAAVRKQIIATSSAAVPAGRYMTVEYESLFGADKAARELVTFRLDEDGIWRFMGYALQPLNGTPKP